MRSMTAGTLGWAVGAFYVVTGTMMLVTPHQFGSITYVMLRPHLGLWGPCFSCSASASSPSWCSPSRVPSRSRSSALGSGASRAELQLPPGLPVAGGSQFWHSRPWRRPRSPRHPHAPGAA